MTFLCRVPPKVARVSCVHAVKLVQLQKRQYDDSLPCLPKLASRSSSHKSELHTLCQTLRDIKSSNSYDLKPITCQPFGSLSLYWASVSHPDKLPASSVGIELFHLLAAGLAPLKSLRMCILTDRSLKWVLEVVCITHD